MPTPIQSKTILHPESLAPAVGAKATTKLPSGVIYDEIRLHITGTYTVGGGGSLAAEFPTNILSDLQLKKNNNDAIYSLASKDIYKINYYDSKSKVIADASAGVFEILLTLNKGVIFADEKLIPPGGRDHPALPITDDLTLTVVAAANADAGTSITITAINIDISYDRLEPTPEQVVERWGERMERYMMPKIGAKQTEALSANTALAEALNVGSDLLLFRGFLVTLDGSEDEQNDRLDQYQIKKNTVPQAELVTNTFGGGRASDKEFYGLDDLLDGVVVVDFNNEITHNGFGYFGEGKETALKILAKIDNSTKLRWISEEYVYRH